MWANCVQTCMCVCICVCVCLLFVLVGDSFGEAKITRDEERLEIWDVGKSVPLRCVNRENITYLGWSLEALKHSRGRMSGRAYLIYLGLEGRLSPSPHFLSWGRGVFVPEAHDRAGLCLGCWRRDTRLSPSAPRSSGSAQSESLWTVLLRIDPGAVLLLSLPACDTDRGAGGPGPGPVGTSTERCPETGEHPSVTGCPLALIRHLGVWVTPASTRPVGEEDWGWERTRERGRWWPWFQAKSG